jgi:hypothetical protein
MAANLVRMAQHAHALAEPAAVPLAPPILPEVTLRPGCHRLTFRPAGGGAAFHGALRVEALGDGATVSGDLYRYARLPGPAPRRRLTAVELPPEVPPPTMSTLGRRVRPLGVPVHARDRYFSYLRVTAVRAPALGPGRVTIVADEYRYIPSARRRADGAFDPVPRVVTLTLEPRPHAPGYTALYLEGTLSVDGREQGAVMLGWVSRSLRDATVDGGSVDHVHLPEIALDGGR